MQQRAFFEAVTVFPALVCNKASLPDSRKTSSVLSFLLRAGLLQKLEMTEPEETPAGEGKSGFLLAICSLSPLPLAKSYS